MRVLQYTIIDVRVNDVNEGIIYESSKFEIFTRKDDKILISVQQLKAQIALVSIMSKLNGIHRIHKWRTRGKKLWPSHESEALEGKQKIANEDFQ